MKKKTSSSFYLSTITLAPSRSSSLATRLTAAVNAFFASAPASLALNIAVRAEEAMGPRSRIAAAISASVGGPRLDGDGAAEEGGGSCCCCCCCCCGGGGGGIGCGGATEGALAFFFPAAAPPPPPPGDGEAEALRFVCFPPAAASGATLLLGAAAAAAPLPPTPTPPPAPKPPPPLLSPPPPSRSRGEHLRLGLLRHLVQVVEVLFVVVQKV